MGIVIALTVILLWASHLYYLLFIYVVDYSAFLTYLHILIQGYLYTGLFITAHDSMHFCVSSHRKINMIIGQLALWLFAAFSFKRMFTNHMITMQLQQVKIPITVVLLRTSLYGFSPSFSLTLQ
jgi:beta-carotene ketolase (CrtW type)